MATYKDKISKKDKKRFEETAMSSINSATNKFNVEYIAPVVALYKKTIMPLMKKALRLKTPKELSKISIKISANEAGLNATLKKLYNSFQRTIYSDKVFEKLGVTNPLAKRTILNNSKALFNQYTEDSLSRMNTKLLSDFRKIQTDLMIENARIDRLIDGGEILKKDRAALLADFEERLIKNNKDYKKLFDDGPYVTYNNGAKHNLDEYVEMSVKTTVMNVDRNAVQMQEMIKKRRVSEYYRRDKTPYKTNIRREVCAQVMAKKFKGTSLIAHDPEAARIFGILTLEQAKARDAFGPNCKHSIKPLSKKQYNRIDTLLFISENEAVS